MVDKKTLEKAINDYTHQTVDPNEVRKISHRISSQIELMVYELIREEIKLAKTP